MFRLIKQGLEPWLSELQNHHTLACSAMYIYVLIFLQVLKGAPVIDGRPGEHLPPLDFDALKESLEEKHDAPMTDEHVMSAALYPKVPPRSVLSYL